MLTEKRKEKRVKIRLWILVLLVGLWVVLIPQYVKAESPVIEAVELFNFRDLTTPVTEFVIGDEVTFTVRFTDADLDCAYLTISEYFLLLPNPDPSSETTYWIVQDTVTDTINSFPDLDPVEISGPAGKWRVDFRIEDEAGNVSNIFEVFVTVYFLKIPDPIPDVPDDDDDDDDRGGGDDDDDGCFIDAGRF